MTQKKYIKITLILCLFFISLGGFLLHYRVHPITASTYSFVPFFAGLISLIVVTALFFFKKWVPYAYLANGMLAIIGTITMAHFSISKFSHPVNFATIFTYSLAADIFIVWGAFFIGKALFELEMPGEANLEKPRHKGRFFRYPNLGYWGVHLAALSCVYALGHLLWK